MALILITNENKAPEGNVESLGGMELSATAMVIPASQTQRGTSSILGRSRTSNWRRQCYVKTMDTVIFRVLLKGKI